MYPFSTKREIRQFHVAVLQLLVLFSFSLPSPSSLLKLPNVYPPATLKLKPCSFVFYLFRKDRGRTTDKAVRV